ncbi:hypothetical protein SynBIOSE41_02809 [Synechococcus sp. BIOS-E4-1]|nr:hypothetical protein SynBIOSE41_02809 [Synechococcus sp. BIOS-E4-1]
MSHFLSTSIGQGFSADYFVVIKTASMASCIRCVLALGEGFACCSSNSHLTTQ